MRTVGETRITLVQGDITRHRADALVNAANSTLLGGGGVDGAIHRVGGPEILEECRRVRERLPEGLPTGDAVATSAGRLPARHVIHTVGPVWRGGAAAEPDLLASCYDRSLALTGELSLATVAFPSISTGVYGYPVKEAAAVATGEVIRFLESHPGAFERVSWVLFDETTFSAYRDALS